MPTLIQRSVLAGSIVAGIALLATSANADEALTATEADQLRFEIQQLKLINQRQVQQLQQMESRLNQLDSRTPTAATQSPQQTAAVATQPPVKRSADPSSSVENILLEEHTLFSDKFTFEVGMDYSHYDRKQLVLDGFLVLDAIFLGDISIDDISADIFTTNLAARYNVNNRWQIGANIPLVYRSTSYQKNYVSDPNTNGQSVIEGDLDSSGLGDITLSSSYQLFPETEGRPDVVWNLSVKAPTGTDPYEMDTVLLATDGFGNEIRVPEELPTGNGMWSLSTGLSFLKTTDPAILFANVGYTHNFSNDFDIAGQNVEISLGDSFNYGVGMAFALNERMSMSMALSHKISLESERDGQKIFGSDGNAATFTTGVTYALSDRLSMLTSVGFGLTPDASDFNIAVRFPYRF